MNRGFPIPALIGLILGAWILVFTLASRIFLILPPDTADQESPLFRILNTGRAEMSADLYHRADLYFHKGVAFTRPPPLTGDPFRKLLDAVAPESVVHLGGQNIREIMPWLRFTTRLDPHHVEAFLVTAFWLSEEAHRPDVAHEVLREALRLNPGAYAIHLGRGKLFLRQKNPKAALQSFSAALRCWPQSPIATSPQDLNFDRAEILTYRALVFEIFNHPADAIRDLEEVLTLFPERHEFRNRIADLAAGRQSLSSAYHLADTLLKTRPPDDDHPDQHADTHEAHDH
jgi:tetratricopeptide (TPR) repeat protein